MMVVCGEALFDVFVKGEDGPGSLDLAARAGGSPFNVAIGMSRLETPSALLTGISDDIFGTRLDAVLTAEGVDRRYLVQTGRRTTLSIVGLNESGSPSYSFYGVGSADCSLTDEDMPDLGDDVTGLHFGSYSIAVAPVADAFAALARRNAERFISLDPNIRPSVEPDMAVWRRRIDTMRALATLIKVSDEDLSYLHPESDPVDVARKWAAGRLVVLTRGGDEVVAIRGNDEVRVTPPTVDVVDTVGAGDTFQACLLSGLTRADLQVDALSSEDLRQLVTEAARAAAITCSRRGADLPSRADLASYDPHG